MSATGIVAGCNSCQFKFCRRSHMPYVTERVETKVERKETFTAHSHVRDLVNPLISAPTLDRLSTIMATSIERQLIVFDFDWSAYTHCKL